jgi:SET domain-containing protein
MFALVFVTMINYTIYINILPNLKSHSLNYIGISCVGGRGVFAGKSYKKDEIIEIAYCIKDKPDFYKNSILIDYLFRYDDTYSLLCLGNGSLYSHSDNPNCTYEIKDDKIYFTCIKPIKKDEEIFISYGDIWWKDRENKIKKIEK